MAGVAGSYGSGRLSLDGLEDRADMAAPRAMGYLGYAGRRWSIDGGAGLARLLYETSRRIRFAALAPTGRPLFGVVDREATSSPSGLGIDAWIDGRVVIPIGSWDAQPRVGGRSTAYRLGDAQEAGAGALSLLGYARTTRSFQADAAMRMTRMTGRVRPFAEARYQRELAAGGVTADMALGGGPGERFQVEGLTLTRGSLAGQGGVTFLSGSLGVSLLYELWHSRRHTKQTLQLGVGF
jgi:hypothetical protein